MSISRLGSPQDNWVEIGTSSPTSGSVVTFSSIANYRKFRLVAFNIALSGSNLIKITFNNDNGTNYADRQGPGTTGLSGNFNPTQAFDLEIEYNSQSTWKKVSGWWIDTGFNFYAGYWKDNSAITEIDLTLSAGTYTSGTFKLYGTN